MKFRIWRSKSKSKTGHRDWRWRLVARNGQVIASGEGYRRRSGAARCVWRIKEEAIYADLVFERRR